MDDPAEREILWRDYSQGVQLYQFYLEMTLKVNTAYYAITGAILSFCLSRPHGDFSRWALSLPLLLSVFFTVLFALSSLLVKNARAASISTSKKLGLLYHDFSPLLYVLRAFSVLHFICVIGIAWLLWRMFN